MIGYACDGVGDTRPYGGRLGREHPSIYSVRRVIQLTSGPAGVSVQVF